MDLHRSTDATVSRLGCLSATLLGALALVLTADALSRAVLELAGALSLAILLLAVAVSVPLLFGTMALVRSLVAPRVYLLPVERERVGLPDADVVNAEWVEVQGDKATTTMG